MVITCTPHLFSKPSFCPLKAIVEWSCHWRHYRPRTEIRMIMRAMWVLSTHPKPFMMASEQKQAYLDTVRRGNFQWHSLLGYAILRGASIIRAFQDIAYYDNMCSPTKSDSDFRILLKVKCLIDEDEARKPAHCVKKFVNWSSLGLQRCWWSNENFAR